MHSHHNTSLDQVNSKLAVKLPKVWSRNFASEIAVIGKANNCFIDAYKALRIEAGRAYEVLGAIIDLSRRFGNGFHFSDHEVLQHMGNTISQSKLYRDKQLLKKMGIIHLAATVKNRTVYYLQDSWFDDFIYGLFNKLGILLRQNDGSHIISNDSYVEHDHNDPLEKAKNHKELIQKLDAIGTDIFTAKKMIKKAGVARVEQELNYVSSLKNITKPGAYLYLIINNLDKNKPSKPTEATRMSESYDTVVNRQQRQVRIEKEARKRLEARGIIDPMTTPKPSYDAAREYSQVLTAEIMAIDRATKSSVDSL